MQFRGHTYYLGPIGSAESRARYVELIRELEEGGKKPAENGSAGGPPAPPAPGEGTVGQLALLWHVHASGEFGAGSAELASYRAALRPVLERHASDRIAAFDARALTRVQADMVTRQWCRNHINRCVVRIRTVWRWAELEGLAAPGSWAALRAVRPLIRPKPGLKVSQKVQPVEWWRLARTAFLGAAPGLRLMILLGWWTGARPSELAKLTAGMIDASGSVWTARLEHHKNAWRGHERVIHFGPEAQVLLAPRLAELADAPDDPVCPDGRGRPFSRRSLYQALRRACGRAGVERWHPYRWRHSFRRRVSREIGLEAARTLMGQRSLTSTEQYAAGIDAQLASEAARKAG